MELTTGVPAAFNSDLNVGLLKYPMTLSCPSCIWETIPPMLASVSGFPIIDSVIDIILSRPKAAWYSWSQINCSLLFCKLCQEQAMLGNLRTSRK